MTEESTLTGSLSAMWAVRGGRFFFVHAARACVRAATYLETPVRLVSAALSCSSHGLQRLREAAHARREACSCGRTESERGWAIRRDRPPSPERRPVLSPWSGLCVQS